MKVHVWNVGHGDAIRIDLSDGYSVIRDFGRSGSAKDTATSIDEFGVIECPLVPEAMTVDAVLSHAHEDHYKGFEELQAENEDPIFEKCFIPWLDFSTANSLGMRMAVLSAFLYAYASPGRKASVSAKHWVRAAPVMASLSRRLFGVSAGHTIQHWPIQASVLWPPPPNEQTEYHKAVKAKVERAIGRFDGGSKGGELPEVERIRRIGGRFGEILRPYYLSNDAPVGQAAESDIAMIDELLSELEEMPRRSFPAGLLKYCWVTHKDSVDNHSLCFRLGSEALFLSDLYPSTINKMCNTYHPTPSPYKLVKSAHHGSRFGRCLQRSIESVESLVHNCGPASLSYNGPDRDYERLGAEEIVCTDWNHESTKWCPIPEDYRRFDQSYEVFEV